MQNPSPDILHPRIFSAGGGLFSTPGDYLRFCQMLLNGGELEGRRLLSRKTIELMTERHSSPIPIRFLRGQYFGLGVAVREDNGDSGMLGSSERGRGGSSVSTAVKMAEGSSESNGLRPVSAR